MNMILISIFNDDSWILYIIAIMINDSSIFISINLGFFRLASDSIGPSLAKAVAGFPPQRDVVDTLGITLW